MRKHNRNLPDQEAAGAPGGRHGQSDGEDGAENRTSETPGGHGTPKGLPVDIELSHEAAELVKQLQSERDQAVDARLRALADFRNYQRRSIENEQRAGQAGAARVVKAMLPVLDHFDLAVAQRADRMSVEQLHAAVRILLDAFNKTLAGQGVERIEPTRGEPFDPNRHEAVMRQAADDLEPNSIVSTMQAGYAMGDQILRPAKVSVSSSPQDE
ncbi:MAG: nucleotide exchange factor GrpE [Phycisphaerales bacterium]|nr:nucleotide exchange factor GrpE [Phycisphaerales bacterium]MCI0629439.1 nucleotide exchange factor GrpE [Phycisphaerales bacterium]MCI0674989.1 nucleotide exchange factor GrpE [Phycisphaerales bacterium]